MLLKSFSLYLVLLLTSSEALSQEALSQEALSQVALSPDAKDPAEYQNCPVIVGGGPLDRLDQCRGVMHRNKILACGGPVKKGSVGLVSRFANGLLRLIGYMSIGSSWTKDLLSKKGGDLMAQIEDGLWNGGHKLRMHSYVFWSSFLLALAIGWLFVLVFWILPVMLSKRLRAYCCDKPCPGWRPNGRLGCCSSEPKTCCYRPRRPWLTRYVRVVIGVVIMTMMALFCLVCGFYFAISMNGRIAETKCGVFDLSYNISFVDIEVTPTTRFGGLLGGGKFLKDSNDRIRSYSNMWDLPNPKGRHAKEILYSFLGSLTWTQELLEKGLFSNWPGMFTTAEVQQIREDGSLISNTSNVSESVSPSVNDFGAIDMKPFQLFMTIDDKHLEILNRYKQAVSALTFDQPVRSRAREDSLAQLADQFGNLETSMTPFMRSLISIYHFLTRSVEHLEEKRNYFRLLWLVSLIVFSAASALLLLAGSIFWKYSKGVTSRKPKESDRWLRYVSFISLICGILGVVFLTVGGVLVRGLYFPSNFCKVYQADFQEQNQWLKYPALVGNNPPQPFNACLNNQASGDLLKEYGISSEFTIKNVEWDALGTLNAANFNTQFLEVLSTLPEPYIFGIFNNKKMSVDSEIGRLHGSHPIDDSRTINKAANKMFTGENPICKQIAICIPDPFDETKPCQGAELPEEVKVLHVTAETVFKPRCLSAECTPKKQDIVALSRSLLLSMYLNSCFNESLHSWGHVADMFYVFFVRTAVFKPLERYPVYYGEDYLGLNHLGVCDIGVPCSVFYTLRNKDALSEGLKNTDYQTWREEANSDGVALSKLENESIDANVEKFVTETFPVNLINGISYSFQRFDCKALNQQLTSLTRLGCNGVAGSIAVVGWANIVLGFLSLTAFIMLTKYWKARKNGDNNLEDDAEELSRRAGCGEDVFLLAAEEGDLATVKICTGVHDPNTTFDLIYNNSPLHLAAHYGHVDCVRYLIQQGYDPNHQNFHNYTPFSAAAASEKMNIDTKLKILSILLRAGSVVDVFDHQGDTALMKATRANDTDVVSFLLDEGADPELRDRMLKQSALIMAEESMVSGDLKRLLSEATTRSQQSPQSGGDSPGRSRFLGGDAN